MIANLSSHPSGSALECDIAIVGAGAAGIAIAREFAGRGERVILLEAGGLDFDETLQDYARGSASGQPYFPLDESRYRLFGGSTFRWGARTAPFKALDFSQRDWVSTTKGWPISLAELGGFYDRAYSMIGIRTPFAFDRGVWDYLNAKPVAFDQSLFDYHAFQFGRNLLFGTRFRNELKQAANIEVLLRAQLLKIETVAEGQHVDHLSVVTPEGASYVVRARTYILAAGGIENARQLLLSGNPDGSGLCNSSGTLGRYFMEHPTVQAGTITARNPQKLVDSFSPGLVGGRLVEVGISLSPERQRQTESLNAIARVAVAVGDDPTQALRELLRNLRHRRLPHTLSWYQKNRYLSERLAIIARDPLSIVLNGARHALGRPKRFKLDSLSLEIRTEQEPSPESRVTLGDDRDANGQRRAHLHWSLGARDKHTMQTLAHDVDREFRRLDIGEIAFAPWLDRDDLDFGADLVGGHHHMGTTRMAAEAADGVVRPDCRAHDVDNLYLAGCSIFPTAGFVNPTATLLALGLRLADHLKGLDG